MKVKLKQRVGESFKEAYLDTVRQLKCWSGQVTSATAVSGWLNRHIIIVHSRSFESFQ
jgi:hypothetical protein